MERVKVDAGTLTLDPAFFMRGRCFVFLFIFFFFSLEVLGFIVAALL